VFKISLDSHCCRRHSFCKILYPILGFISVVVVAVVVW
jgi:hypothetical protein